MLNISKNRVHQKIDTDRFSSFGKVSTPPIHKKLTLMILILGGISLIIMFLPWTQNIRAKGKVTTLRPEQRPQEVMSPIPARIAQWFVREGEFVQKGDTLLRIEEIKAEYLDPRLVERTEMQIQAKREALNSYSEKIEALDSQIHALQNMQKLKTEQAKNKINQAGLALQRDSLNLEAAQADFNIAAAQLTRMEKMIERGLRTQVELEKRRLKLQETKAKFLGLKNKVLESQNELINARIELQNIKNDFQEKLGKARSDRFSAISSQQATEAEIAKLENQKSNYENRRNMRFVKAPQSGYVTEALQAGIGHTVREGASFLSIMPVDYQLAVSAFIDPIDLPLMELGQRVRIQFDGWPAIVFSGWENISYGTYAGRVVAMDNFANQNGQFRILIGPDPEEPDWPTQLRPGGGAMTLTLLEDVPLWYEIWRQFNGFPPNFYDMNPPEKIEKFKFPK